MNRLICLGSTDSQIQDVCVKWGGVKYKLVLATYVGAALVHSGQVAGSDVESWYGYTVLLLTLRYVHELSIKRLLFVYACTTEGRYKNVGAVVIVW